MKNEPVAWTNGHGIFDIYVSDVCTIPLYTHPADLTNEEITEVLNDENIAEYHQGNWRVLPYAFARAILRKAQEKPTKKCGDSYDTVCPPSICDCRKVQKK